MRAGIYARISLDAAGDALGVKRQVDLCRELAERKGWDVAEVYADNDQSASTGKDRPAYLRMLADLEAGNIGAVLVYAIDRLTRRPVELENFIDLVERHGVELANVAGDVDLSTIQGRLTARIMGSVARAEAENIGKRVRDQKLQRAMSGVPHKGRHRLYGYDSEWNVIEAEAGIVREAFKRRASGESTTAIARDFIARGVTGINGKPLSHGVLVRYLQTHTYAGKVTFKGEVVADSIYPALTDPDTFNAAQANIANDSKGTNARKYLLSGILLCRYCLSPMKGNPSNHMYRCSTTYGGCGRLSVRIALADKWVTWAAMQKANETPKKPERVRDYDAEITDLDANIRRTQEAFEAGIYTLKEAQGKIAQYRAGIAEATKAKAQAVPRHNFATQKYMDFKRMTLSQQRAFISTHVENVVVGASISRGHQPFNPRRFEAHYTDGTVLPIEPDVAPEED